MYKVNVFLYFFVQPVVYLVLFALIYYEKVIKYDQGKRSDWALVYRFLCWVSLLPFLTFLVDVFIEFYDRFWGNGAYFYNLYLADAFNCLGAYRISFDLPSCDVVPMLETWFLTGIYFILYFSRYKRYGLWIYFLNLIVFVPNFIRYI